MKIWLEVSLYNMSLMRKKYSPKVFVNLLAILGMIGFSGGTLAEGSASTLVKSSQSTSFIPRSEYFADPTYSSLKISPDGKKIAYIKPFNGVRNIWIGSVDSPKTAVPVTSFKEAPRSFRWSADGQFLLVLEHWVAKEINQLWSVELESGTVKNLTNDVTTRTEIIATSKKYPTKVLVSLNTRDARFEDVYLMDMQTGEREEVFRNDGRFISFRANADLKVNIGERGNDDGSSTYIRLDGDTRSELLTVPLDAYRSTKIISYDSDKGIITLLDSVESEYTNLVEFDTATGKRNILAKAIEADITEVFYDKKSKALWATKEDPLMPKWTVRSPKAVDEFAALEKTFGHSFSIVGQPDEKRLLILQSPSGKPNRYHWWDRKTKTATLIFSTRPNLEKYTLAPTKGVMIPARDGILLPTYFTLPLGTPVNADGFPIKPMPLVVSLHGGPWLRKRPGFNSNHPIDAWLADRGYAVLSINFRASVGFGKSFTSAGDKQWAGDMHNDVIDSVDWAIKNGITERDKVASYGYSYGGYASMVSLTFTPDRFQCSIAGAGPSNLKRILTDMPAWWRYQWPQWIHRVGDPTTRQGVADLMERSPISRVADIKGKLLLFTGGEDARVLERQAEEMVGAMEALNKPVTYLLYEREGHGGHRAETTISRMAVTEHFLSKCFGKKAEAFGSDLERSDMEVKSGVDLIPTLFEALKKTGTKRFSKPHILSE
ncbi:S9 family peptidase [Colwellia sp. RE-S-Sl-9]